MNRHEGHASIIEVSNFDLGSKNKIIDQNGAEMKMKMKNIRDKFEQMQKQKLQKNGESNVKEGNVGLDY